MNINTTNTLAEQTLKNLIETDSTSGSERNVLEKIEEILQEANFVMERIPVTTNTFCIYAHTGTPTVILQAHVDTVPPFIPFSQDTDKIFGRGACDTKGSVAAMITAGISAKQKGLKNFGLLFTVEEETTFAGAIAAAKIFSQPLPYFIVGEPSQLKPVTNHFGIAVFEITAVGVAAHTSNPEKGVNAIDVLLSACETLKQLKLGKETLASLVQISGGVADNVVPPQASLLLSMRIAPGDQTDYAREITALVKPCNVTAKGSLAPVQGNLPKFLSFLGDAQTVRYCTELSFFQNGCILGPGDIAQAHTKDEFVLKKDLAKAVVLYGQIIEKFQERTNEK